MNGKRDLTPLLSFKHYVIMLEDMGCAKLKKSKDQQQAQELKWFRKVLTENDGMITAHVASYFHIRQQEIERGGTGF